MSEATAKKVKGERKKFKKNFVNKNNFPYIVLTPAVLLFTLFVAYPAIASFVLSCQQRIDGESTFVGFLNYTRLFFDPVFYQALFNTFIILIFQVPIMLFLGLIIAVCLNSSLIKFKGFFRVAFFLPAVTSLVAASLIFLLLLNDDYGLINYLLGLVGLPEIAWLSDSFWAKVSLILLTTWRWTGYNMVIIIAGLQGVSKELYEAASIDGAGTIKKFFTITIPQLKPVLLFCFVLSTIGTFQLFDEPFNLTAGGPNDATLTITYFLYQQGFEFFDFGYASAIAYIIVILVAVLSWVQFKLTGDE